MATNMTLGMALWMKVRRHSWPRIAEMSGGVGGVRSVGVVFSLP